MRIRAGQGDATNILTTGNETVGVLYMDSRVIAADLAGGNRELLQTLAIEASTVLENARLLQEEETKRQMEEELRVARTIQQSLLPRKLPDEGWLRASGSSVASYQVGGDYFDVTPVSGTCWSAVVADVSGKGVASALLASLLQGALITATDAAAGAGRAVWSGSIASCWTVPEAKSTPRCSIPCCTRTDGWTISTPRILRRWWCAAAAAGSNWRPTRCRWA